jgi:S-(hydroxymethyl)glutathione dehydrogenase/alcohol dehydrogenase
MWRHADGKFSCASVAVTRMGKEARAVVCRQPNTEVVVETIKVGSPRRREVMIEVAACGVCHSDLSVTTGTIPMPPPVVLGHEGAGIVVEVGEDVEGLAVGDHVISCFISACGTCRYCLKNRPSLCEQASRTVSTLPDGTLRTRDSGGMPLNVFCGCGVMAEFATLSVDSVVKVSRDVPLDRAALVGCSVITGFGAATRTAQIEAGSSAIVFGAGGVGLNVIQACVLNRAAMIVAVDLSPQKLETARRFGATHTLNATEHTNVVKALRALTNGGADYSFECVGRGNVVSQAYGVLRKGGKAVVIGVAAPKETAAIAVMSLTLEERTLTGSYLGSGQPREDFHRILALYGAGQLKLDELITRTYGIEEAPEAFRDLAAGRNARGVVLF